MAVERKYERDIDLLVAEELSVSQGFRSWFLQQTKFSASDNCALVDVFVSWSDSSGESDLVAVFARSDGSPFAIHVENKIDAPFMPNQRERYDARAKAAVERGDYADYQVVLCAPQRYLDTSKGAAAFQTAISYEDIADTLIELGRNDRANYRANFLVNAAIKSANNWERKDDPDTNAFWNAAYQLASKEFPILELKPLSLTAGSNWINVRPHDFPRQPKDTYLALKGGRGNIDLTFTRTEAYLLSEMIGRILDTDMTVHQTGAAAAVRLTVEAFQISDGIESGMKKMRSAFQALERLIRFYRANKKLLDHSALESTR